MSWDLNEHRSWWEIPVAKTVPGRESIEQKGSRETQACRVGVIARGQGHLAGWNEGKVEEMNLETLQGSDF